MAAARAGKHIFCEKPLARTVEEAREMYRAARDTGLRTVVGFSNRWAPVVNAIRSLLEHDEIGAITHVHGQAFNASLVRSARPRFTWRTDAARTGSGILGDLGAHYVDLTHFLLGDIAEVCADLRTVVPELYDDTGQAHSQRVDDDVTMLLTLATGAHGSLALSRLGPVDANMPVGRRLFLIDGRKGGIKLENGRAWLYRPDGTEQPIEAEEPQHAAGHAGALLAGAVRQMESFVRAIRGEPDPAPTFRDGLRCQEVLHAAVESSRRRQWQPVVRVPEA
jgi:predicted dehydrogenase